MIFLLGARLVSTYCLKFGAILKSWPQIKVCLFSKTQKNSIGQVFLIDSITPNFLIKSIEPVAPLDLVELVTLVSLVDPACPKNCFSISKLKFLMRLALTIVCI
jgi:hypothetical protein